MTNDLKYIIIKSKLRNRQSAGKLINCLVKKKGSDSMYVKKNRKSGGKTVKLTLEYVKEKFAEKGWNSLLGIQ